MWGSSQVFVHVYEHGAGAAATAGKHKPRRPVPPAPQGVCAAAGALAGRQHRPRHVHQTCDMSSHVKPVVPRSDASARARQKQAGLCSDAFSTPGRLFLLPRRTKAAAANARTHVASFPVTASLRPQAPSAEATSALAPQPAGAGAPRRAWGAPWREGQAAANQPVSTLYRLGWDLPVRSMHEQAAGALHGPRARPGKAIVPSAFAARRAGLLARAPPPAGGRPRIRCLLREASLPLATEKGARKPATVTVVWLFGWPLGPPGGRRVGRAREQAGCAGRRAGGLRAGNKEGKRVRCGGMGRRRDKGTAGALWAAASRRGRRPHGPQAGG
jgi:hypothetical protein